MLSKLEKKNYKHYISSQSYYICVNIYPNLQKHVLQCSAELDKNN